MINEAITIALIVAVPSAVVPLAMQWITGRQRAQETAAANARLDLVAEKAQEAADKVSEVAIQAATAADKVTEVASQAAEAATLLLKSNSSATAERAGMKGQLEQIHTLVNSGKTELMEEKLTGTKATLLATKATLLATRALMAVAPSAEVAAQIKSVEIDITAIEKDIAVQNKILAERGITTDNAAIQKATTDATAGAE